MLPAIASHTVLYNYQAQTPNNALDSACCSIKETSPSCRISTSKCASSSRSSLKHCTNPGISHTYHSFNGKELTLQFNQLQVTLDEHNIKETIPKNAPKYSSALTLKAVKHQPLKRASISKKGRKSKGGNKSSAASKFVLKPSKLNRCVKAAFTRSYADFNRGRPSSDLKKSEKDLSVYHEFSAACGKELETIALGTSTSVENTLRPRSSSLPAAGTPSLDSASSSLPSTSQTKNGNAEELANQVSTKRSRRKHLSKCDQKHSKNDINQNDVGLIDSRITSRANKRRKSPPRSSIPISVQQSIGSSENKKDKAQDTLDASIDRLADYLEDSILLPKKMSFMAEMMYT